MQTEVHGFAFWALMYSLLDFFRHTYLRVPPSSIKNHFSINIGEDISLAQDLFIFIAMTYLFGSNCLMPVSEMHWNPHDHLNSDHGRYKGGFRVVSSHFSCAHKISEATGIKTCRSYQDNTVSCSSPAILYFFWQ